MKRHRKNLLAVMIGISVTLGAYAIGRTHQSGDIARTERSVSIPPKHFGEHDEGRAAGTPAVGRAYIEIHEHAQRHLAHFVERPGTFGGTSLWSDEWDLHWLVVEHQGESVRIYHATHKLHPRNRFTIHWHEHQPRPGEWERIH